MTTDNSDEGSGEWQVAVNSGPEISIIKWRSDVKFPDPGLPFRIIVGVKFRHIAENGMPDPRAETPFLADLENELLAGFEAHGSKLVLTVTGRGSREWVAYAPSQDWIEKWAPEFGNRWLKGRNSRIKVARDPKWNIYKKFSGRHGPGVRVE
jgi:Family of unknown function (DUF695)